MKRRYRFKIFAACSLFATVLASLAIGSYAWFTVNQASQISITEVTVEGGMSCNIKYFTGNFNEDNQKYSGYYDPKGPQAGLEGGASVTNYNTDFLQTEEANPFKGENFFTNYCLTFAFEVTSERKSDASFVIHLFDLNPGESDTFFVSDIGLPVCFAEAIRMYSTAFSYDEGTNTANADAFIQDHGSNNVFTYDRSKNIATNPYLLYQGEIKAQETVVVLLTLLFTDDSETYYQITGTGEKDDGSIIYNVEKNTSGNSNCYQGLSFIMTGLSVEWD